MTKVNGWAVTFFIFIATSVTSQENTDKEIKEEAVKGTHRLSLVLGHSHVSEGIQDNGKKGWKVIPSTGFDYDYWISEHWALGLQNDIMIEN
ncbi:MAG TPA: hypothetical protein VFO37_04375, partial [Chitinophagaceae bacterium]|nr:hypothetical protein [Chitinophagaceae bacterium]